jgi:hypothetical protein
LAGCVPCVHWMKFLCIKCLGTKPTYLPAKNKVCRCRNFGEEEVWSKSWPQRVRICVREAMT